MRFQSLAAFFIISVLTAGLTVAAQTKKAPPAKPLDLNTATLEQFEQLPGVGPRTAKDIVQFREKGGPFRRVEDLLAIPRITRKRFEQIRRYVFVAPPPASKNL